MIFTFPGNCKPFTLESISLSSVALMKGLLDYELPVYSLFGVESYQERTHPIHNTKCNII